MPCQPGTPITQVSGAGRLLEPHRVCCSISLTIPGTGHRIGLGGLGGCGHRDDHADPPPDSQLTGTDAGLLRPDGYVAWTSPDGDDLASALRRWFGPDQRTADGLFTS